MKLAQIEIVQTSETWQGLDGGVCHRITCPLLHALPDHTGKAPRVIGRAVIPYPHGDAAPTGDEAREILAAVAQWVAPEYVTEEAVRGLGATLKVSDIPSAARIYTVIGPDGNEINEVIVGFLGGGING